MNQPYLIKSSLTPYTEEMAKEIDELLKGVAID